MLKNLDNFYAYVLLFVVLAIAIPLLLVLATQVGKRVGSSAVQVNVIAPNENNDSLSYQNQLQQAALQGDISVNPNAGVQNNPDSRVYTVQIRDGFISEPVIVVKQKSTVKFENLALAPIRVVGTSWGSGEFIQPKKSFAQSFNIKGEYEYTIVGINAAYGKIVVE